MCGFISWLGLRNGLRKAVRLSAVCGMFFQSIATTDGVVKVKAVQKMQLGKQCVKAYKDSLKGRTDYSARIPCPRECQCETLVSAAVGALA